GVGMSALGMLGFSDRRLKEDITPVGALNDGQTVYSYRYKGDPRTQIGLLAQEVERVHPEAVARHPSGYRMVDYRRATRSARSGQAAASAPGGLM
ncbi:MAG TPA: tail fiber domain-containing protein, partial [Reyranella sp.]